MAIIERQLRLRARLMRACRIDRENLFFTDDGVPIPDVKYPYARWERTLKRLALSADSDDPKAVDLPVADPRY